MTDRERRDEAVLRPCINCGRDQTRNPHPHAGSPGHPEADYEYHCVPCLVENRHRWAQRAMKAEAERDGLAAKIEAVEALRGRLEAAAISCHAIGAFEREADYCSTIEAIRAALSASPAGVREDPK